MVNFREIEFESFSDTDITSISKQFRDKMQSGNVNAAMKLLTMNDSHVEILFVMLAFVVLFLKIWIMVFTIYFVLNTAVGKEFRKK